jgi:TolB protein
MRVISKQNRFAALAAVVGLAAVPAVWNGAAARADVPRVAGRIAISSMQSGNSEIYVVDPDGTGLTNITNNAADEAWPMWSADGSHIAFTSNRDGTPGIYIADADGANPHLAITGTAIFPAWSPDGSTFAFHRGQGIISANVDGSGEQILTTPDATAHAIDYFPAWSPDGTKIAFKRSGTIEPGIWLMNADGSGAALLAAGPDGRSAQAPDFSPDGTKIAFNSGSTAVESAIYTVGVDGANLTRASHPGIDALSPRWSADGTRLSFLSHDPTTPGSEALSVGVMNADGSEATVFAELPRTDTLQSWQSLPGPASPVPAAPRGIAVTPGQGFVNVSWSPPTRDGGTAVTSYMVAASYAGAVTASQRVAGDVRNVSLSGLANGRIYAVAVVAINGNGWGQLSTPVSAAPAAAAAASTVPAAPTFADAGVGNGYISATWAPPATDGGAPIVAYSVVARDTTTNALTWASVAADVRQASVPGLVNTHAYDTSIVAWNSKGVGRAVTIAGRTPSAQAAGATTPAHVGFQVARISGSAGARTLSVVWGPGPDHGAPITAYSVVVLEGTRRIAWVNVSAATRSAVVTGVPSGQPLTIYVLPSNRLGFTAAATAMVATA